MLGPLWYGPYIITKQVGYHAFELNLLAYLVLHLVSIRIDYGCQDLEVKWKAQEKEMNMERINCIQFQ